MLNRILIYNSGGGIGDAIQILPLIHTLKTELKNKVIIGTAQFGLNYGIKKKAAVNLKEIRRILNFAKKNSVKTFSTLNMFLTVFPSRNAPDMLL